MLFKDKDFKLRVPAPNYYSYKSLETLALAASWTNPKLKCFIVCPGFIYGLGEQLLFSYFKVRLQLINNLIIFFNL